MKRYGRVRTWVIVAASALAASSAHAATVWNVPGTGSNVCTVANPNCNTIAQAVTASSSGDTIQIGAGTFAVSAVIVLTKTLTIIGSGIGTTLVQPAAGVTGFSVRTSNIVIRDLTMQNGGIGIAFQSASSNNTQITRVAFSGQTVRGVDVSLSAALTVSNVAIANCTFATTAATGIRTSSTAQVTGLTITGSSFTGNAYGLYVANDNSTSRFSGLTIQTSTFTNNANYAIYAEEMRDAVIEDSTFAGGSAGIGLFKFYGSNGVAVSNVTIRRNTFSAFKSNALDLEVYLGGATPGVGLENPITVEDNTIQKDVSISTSSATVFVRLPPSLTNAAVNVLDNDIALSGTFGSGTRAHALQLRGNGPIVITGNVLDGGNVGGSGTTPPSSGIFIESQSASTSLPSGTFSNVMPATVSIGASCNRIQGFRNAVSVFDSIASAYGGLQAGASVTLTSNAVLGNDTGVVTAAAPPTIAAESNYWGCPAGPSDPACDGVTGNVDADPFLSVLPGCVACVADAECDDGLFCSGAETCDGGSGACVPSSDPCAGGPECGNVCNEAADDCNVPAGTVCRSAAGACDVAETCAGAGGPCPVDALAPSGTECRTSAGACDVSETCDGVTTSCPADTLASSGTVCRPAADVCDVAEACSGTDATCPTDVKQSAGTGCADDGNPCSLDQCDGSSDTCQHPAGNAGTGCRGAAGVCDVAETCDGVSTTCPPDVKSTAECRAAAGVCDVAELCDGSGNTCPPDVKSTAECRATAGVCDVAEVCDGSSTDCPADAFAPSSTVCRPSSGTCDIAETCTGSSASCPVDTGLPDGDGDTVCDAIDNCVATANSSQSNADGDALGDACDPCTNVVPTGQEKAKLVLTKLLPPANDEKVSFKGFFTNVPSTPVIDPAANGMRFLVTDSTGLLPIDVTIPGGAYVPLDKAGWKVNGTGTAWTYKNSGTVVPLVNGITKMQLKKLTTPVGKYKFAVKGKNGNYPIDTAHLPLVGTLVIDVPFATTGQCGEAAFPGPTPPACTLLSSGRTVKCK